MIHHNQGYLSFKVISPVANTVVGNLFKDQSGCLPDGKTSNWVMLWMFCFIMVKYPDIYVYPRAQLYRHRLLGSNVHNSSGCHVDASASNYLGFKLLILWVVALEGFVEGAPVINGRDNSWTCLWVLVFSSTRPVGASFFNSPGKACDRGEFSAAT